MKTPKPSRADALKAILDKKAQERDSQKKALADSPAPTGLSKTPSTTPVSAIPTQPPPPEDLPTSNDNSASLSQGIADRMAHSSAPATRRKTGERNDTTLADAIGGTSQKPDVHLDEAIPVGFDRARWKAFVEKLRKEAEQSSTPQDTEALARLKDPEYIASVIASLENFAKDPKHKDTVTTINTLVTRGQEAQKRLTEADEETKSRWESELNTFLKDPEFLDATDNPLISLMQAAQAPESLKAISEIKKIATPNVSIPKEILPPGISEKTWSGVNWTAAAISTLATMWGFSELIGAASKEYAPNFRESVDLAMRSLPGEPTILFITGGIGLTLSMLVSYGIKRGRDELASTGFKHKTGLLRAMAQNPTAALLFASSVVVSGGGAIKGVVANVAKAEQTQVFGGEAIKQVGPVLEKANTTYENAKSFNIDFDRYLFLLVKEEGEPLTEGEISEKNALVGKGWSFPTVSKQIVGPKAYTKAWAIDGRTAQLADPKFQSEAQRLKDAVTKAIPADKLPLKKYSGELLGGVKLSEISEKVQRELTKLKSGLEQSQGNKYATALLMFLGLVNADPQTVQDTLSYTKRDIDMLPGEASGLKDKLGNIGSTYSSILRTIQGGATNLQVVFPILPMAEQGTQKNIEDAFQKIKGMLPERPASIWIPESDWVSAMQFLGLQDSPENRHYVLGAGLAAYGFIDLVIALLYLRSSRKKKEHLDLKVPEVFDDLEHAETDVAHALLARLESVRPMIHSVLGIDPPRVDIEYLRAMLQQRAENELPALKTFREWEQTHRGTAEYDRDVSARKNQLIQPYGSWLTHMLEKLTEEILLPTDLVHEAYPQYKHAVEYLKVIQEKKVSGKELTEAYLRLRAHALEETDAKQHEHITQLIETITAEEAARRSLSLEVSSEGEQESEFVKQLYAGVVFPLKEDVSHQIVTLLGQNTSLLKLQYVTEQQKLRRMQLQNMIKDLHPSIKQTYKKWIGSDGSVTVPEEVLSKFESAAANPRSREYTVRERIKENLTRDIFGGELQEKDFNQARALEQLNAIRTSFAPHVEKSASSHEFLKKYGIEVNYGVDQSSGRPTVLVNLYDKESHTRVVGAAYPGKVPNMREENPSVVDTMLHDWYELVVENELVMKLHAREIDEVRQKTFTESQFDTTMNLKTLDLSSFHYDDLVQYTIETQRSRLLNERTSQDLLSNPITDVEMEMLRHGDMIAIRGYRKFDSETLRIVFAEVQDASKEHPELSFTYNIETRLLQVRDDASGRETTVPLIYYQNMENLLTTITQVNKKVTS